MKINRKIFAELAEAILLVGAKSALHFLDDRTVVKATRWGKMDKRERHVEILFSVGPPNFRERQKIGCGKKANHLKVKGRTFFTYDKKKK